MPVRGFRPPNRRYETVPVIQSDVSSTAAPQLTHNDPQKKKLKRTLSPKIGEATNVPNLSRRIPLWKSLSQDEKKSCIENATEPLYSSFSKNEQFDPDIDSYLVLRRKLQHQQHLEERRAMIQRANDNRSTTQSTREFNLKHDAIVNQANQLRRMDESTRQHILQKHEEEQQQQQDTQQQQQETLSGRASGGGVRPTTSCSTTTNTHSGSRPTSARNVPLSSVAVCSQQVASAVRRPSSSYSTSCAVPPTTNRPLSARRPPFSSGALLQRPQSGSAATATTSAGSGSGTRAAAGGAPQAQQPTQQPRRGVVAISEEEPSDFEKQDTSRLDVVAAAAAAPSSSSPSSPKKTATTISNSSSGMLFQQNSWSSTISSAAGAPPIMLTEEEDDDDEDDIIQQDDADDDVDNENDRDDGSAAKKASSSSTTQQQQRRHHHHHHHGGARRARPMTAPPDRFKALPGALAAAGRMKLAASAAGGDKSALSAIAAMNAKSMINVSSLVPADMDAHNISGGAGAVAELRRRFASRGAGAGAGGSPVSGRSSRSSDHHDHHLRLQRRTSPPRSDGDDASGVGVGDDSRSSPATATQHFDKAAAASTSSAGGVVVPPFFVTEVLNTSGGDSVNSSSGRRYPSGRDAPTSYDLMALIAQTNFERYAVQGERQPGSARVYSARGAGRGGGDSSSHHHHHHPVSQFEISAGVTAASPAQDENIDSYEKRSSQVTTPFVRQGAVNALQEWLKQCRETSTSPRASPRCSSAMLLSSSPRVRR